jgi:DinB family protein
MVAMINEDRFVAVALSAWKATIDRADKLFSALTEEQLLKEVASGKNRLIYLWGHLTAVHDAMLPLLAFGPRLHPEFDNAFITNPDKAVSSMPSADEVRKSWKEVNGKLSEEFAKLQSEQWLEKHTSVSDADFAKEPLRNRLAVLLSRTNHVAYHLGQAVLSPK